MTVKDIRKLTTQFKDFYAKHGGTDHTEKQLLRPISDYIKNEGKT